LYPCTFPETFGISSLESLLYKTPILTNRFGALEETALNLACYHIDYAIAPNDLFPHINKNEQIKKFINAFFDAYDNHYLHQQKQNYCEVVKDISGWDTIALQWKQFLYSITDNFLSVNEYRNVTRINDKVSRIFGRTSQMPTLNEYKSYVTERKIIVISPFWNAEKYIKNNILSVAQQNYNNYLHVLIDDASTDNGGKITLDVIEALPEDIQKKIKLLKNQENKGSIRNQLEAIRMFCTEDDVVMLLDGDDWLITNNTIFQYYNDLYAQGYEFTYGSMWSLTDDIPLIAQEYPIEIKKSKSYRNHHFNWKIPYTHLRTSLSKHFQDLDTTKFCIDGKWMKSGADNPLFYELIEKVQPEKIYCNKEIVCKYNDLNPLNDYKIRGAEQNQNANLSYKAKKKILLCIPTSKYIETETFKSIWNLHIPDGYELDFQYFYGYSRTQVVNLACEWAKRYDYLMIINHNTILSKEILSDCILTNSDIISMDVYESLFVNSVVIRNMGYPHFNPAETKTIEREVFIQRAKDIGASVSHLVDETGNISK
jgi:glycosyltransferase involved in cell wall biosynthesis